MKWNEKRIKGTRGNGSYPMLFQRRAFRFGQNTKNKQKKKKKYTMFTVEKRWFHRAFFPPLLSKRRRTRGIEAFSLSIKKKAKKYKRCINYHRSSIIGFINLRNDPCSTRNFAPPPLSLPQLEGRETRGTSRFQLLPPHHLLFRKHFSISGFVEGLEVRRINVRISLCKYKRERE